MELTREDEIKLQKHKLGICDDLRDIEATLKSLKYDSVLNFVHKNLKELQQFQPNLNSKEANEVIKDWTEEKKTILLRMQTKLKAIKRKREDDDKENQPKKKRYFQSGIEALLAAAAVLDAEDNKHNTSDWSETESHLDLSTEAIDLSKAIKQESKIATKSIDLTHSVNRQAPVRRAVFAVNGCLFGNPRKPVLWKRPTNARQQPLTHVSSNEHQQDESSSNEDSDLSETQTSFEAFDNTTELQRSLTHLAPLSHSTPHASAKRSSTSTAHVQGEIETKAFKPILAVTPQITDESACHIKSLRAATLMHINIKEEVTADHTRENTVHQHSGAATSAKDIKIEDYILIGPNGTIIPKYQYDKINWRTPSAATRSLLLTLFTEEYLASHCLSGKPSPAFIGRERPTKAQLDPAKIKDIIHCVVNQMSCSDREVKQTITTQCADTAKKMRKRKSGNQKQSERN